jgi:glycosyltransferase involved in cell wall biosynthesis
MPKVSIITPLYNKVAYIADTIKSVMSQTYSDWEMLVVDNGSTDGSWEKAQALQEPRIRLLQSPKQGPGAARNYGLTYAQGEWIQFLDADDLLEPTHLEDQLSIEKQNPEAEIIVCYWQEYTEENPMERILKKPSGFGGPIKVLRDGAIAFAPWAVHAAMVKREILEDPYYWVEELDPYVSEDTAFWFRVISKYTVAYSTGKGALYRRLDSSRDRYDQPAKWFQGIKAVHDSNISFLKQQALPLTAKHCETLMRCYSEIYLRARRQGDLETADASLKLAQQWLQESFALDSKNSISLLVRRILGLSTFLTMVYAQQLIKGIFK